MRNRVSIAISSTRESAAYYLETALQTLPILTMAMEDVFQVEVLGGTMQLQDKANTMAVSGYICPLHLVMKHSAPCRLHTWHSFLALVMVDQAAPVDKDAQKANFYVIDNTEFWDAKIYQPLDPSKKEIRILKILPATEDDEIICELEQNVSLLALSESQPWTGHLQMFQLEAWDASDYYRQSAELVDEADGAETSVADGNVPPSALQAQWYLPNAKFASLQQIPEGMEYFGLSLCCWGSQGAAGCYCQRNTI